MHRALLAALASSLALAPSLALAQPAPAASARPLPALDASLGLRLYGRHLYYTDDLFRRMRPYSVAGVPALAGSVTFFPGALVSRGAASWVGLVVTGEWTPYLASVDAQDRAYSTAAYTLSVGAVARYPIGRFEPALSLAYVRQAFTIDRSSVSLAPPDGLPGVTYESLRATVSSRVELSRRFGASASVGFLLPVAFGELGTGAFFPNVTGGGVEASVGGSFSLSPALEARLALDWRRYFLTMNPTRGAALIAGGAADDFYGATLSVAFRR